MQVFYVLSVGCCCWVFLVNPCVLLYGGDARISPPRQECRASHDNSVGCFFGPGIRGFLCAMVPVYAHHWRTISNGIIIALSMRWINWVIVQCGATGAMNALPESGAVYKNLISLSKHNTIYIRQRTREKKA